MTFGTSNTPNKLARSKPGPKQRTWPGYVATTVVAFVGVALCLAVQRLQSEIWKQPISTAAARVGLLLTLMLGFVIIITIRLISISEQRRKALARSDETLQEHSRRHQEADRQLQLMFSRHPCPMWIYDRTSLFFLDVNEATVRQYGYSREELLGMTIKDIRPDEEISALVRDVDQIDRGHSNRGVWRHRRKDGSLLFAEITAFAYEKDGDIQTVVLANDVTKRVEAEEELRRSQASLQSLIDNAPFGICRGSIEGDRFEMLNPAFAAMLGDYTPEELYRLTLSSEVYADPRDRARLIATLRRDRKIQGFETMMLKRNGGKVRVRITGVLCDHSNDEEHFEGYVEDLTQQSSLEQQVRQVQKLEAVGRLAGGVAHDFNNILVVIKLSTEMMLHQITLDNALAKPLLQVSKAADRAAALTRQMLAFGRQQIMQARILNVNTVVAEISHMLRRIIGEDIELITSLSETVANSRLDSDQLGQVLLNLAVNARDAMPHGGTLHIETASVELDNAYIQRHPPVIAGNYVMLAVSDTGTGIPKAALPHIFDPFFTTKEVGKGTGLGLSIVYGIVKQSGGYIWVYSEPDLGTSFKLYFPATNAAPEQLPAVTECGVGSSGKGVLLVDDDEVVRGNISDCLQQLGHQVYEANCAEAALAICGEHLDTIDLVLTDLVMPGMGGHEFATVLGERYPGIRVLFMSGYTEDNAARRAILLKGGLFLQKPFSVAELSRTLQTALDSAAVLSEVRS